MEKEPNDPIFLYVYPSLPETASTIPDLEEREPIILKVPTRAVNKYELPAGPIVQWCEVSVVVIQSQITDRSLGTLANE